MAKENGSELAMWQGIRRCAMHLRPPAHAGAISSFSYSAAPQLVLTLLLATSCSAVGCGKTNAASTIPTLEVEVGLVVQQDVPIFSGWVATLDGYVNAQIQPQVTGYIRRQTYNEGSSAHKGQIIFLYRSAYLPSSARTSERPTGTGSGSTRQDRNGCRPKHPLAKERGIPHSQLDNDIQANRATKAAVPNVKADWYYREAYQSVARHRKRGAIYHGLIVKDVS